MRTRRRVSTRGRSRPPCACLFHSLRCNAETRPRTRGGTRVLRLSCLVHVRRQLRCGTYKWRLPRNAAKPIVVRLAKASAGWGPEARWPTRQPDTAAVPAASAGLDRPPGTQQHQKKRSNNSQQPQAGVRASETDGFTNVFALQFTTRVFRHRHAPSAFASRRLTTGRDRS